MSIPVISATFGSQRASVRVSVVRMLALSLGLGFCATTSRANDPTDAAVRVPPVVYLSLLPGAAAAVPQRVGSWRDANDLTGRIGGWRAYLREAQGRGSGTATPEAAPAAPAASAAAPAPAATTPRTTPAASAPPASPHKH